MKRRFNERYGLVATVENRPSTCWRNESQSCDATSSRFAGEVDVTRLLCPFEDLLLSAEPVLFVLTGFAARGFHTAHRPALVSCLVLGYILLVLWDTTARSAATQNLRNRRMTKRHVLRLKSVLPAEQSSGTTMPPNRTRSYASSGWPLAHLGAVGQRYHRLIGAVSRN